jgi:peptidoglycan/LPS O-acetylase OafA/YrhL
MTFRADVQALRAWAVACVVLYHFKVVGFGGGFMGVDVFFVVSGYLMTDIICRGLDAQSFAYGRFLLARVRRIVPGLLALLGLTLVLGAFMAAPEAFAELGRDALASALFVSNMSYVSTTDYFAGPSEYRWLLHTWSLSLEWQFYMLWPLGLMLAHKRGWRPRTLLVVCALAAALSFGMGVWGTAHKPGLTFYMLPTRAWELLAGALVVLHCRQRAGDAPGPSPAKALLGWALLAPLPWALAHLAWPGPWAALPCLGAVLVLAGGHDRPIWVRSPAVQALGRWSYSVYLIHWPLHVLTLMLGWNSPLATAGAIVAAVAMGGLSHRFIETPGRQWLSQAADRPKGWLRPDAWLPVGALALVLISAALVDRSGGWPDRVAPRVRDLEGSAGWYSPYRPDCLTFPKSPLELMRCGKGNQAEPVGLYIWGDSHGDAILTAINQAVQVRTEFSGHAGCAPVPGEHGRGARCGAFSRMAQAYFEATPEGSPILIVGRFTDYFHPLEGDGDNPVRRAWASWRHADGDANQGEFLAAMSQSMCALARHHPVHVLRPLPEMHAHVPIRATIAEMLGPGFTDDTIAEPLPAVRARHAAVNAQLDAIASRCGIHLIDALPTLCPGGMCRAAAHGQPMFIDHDHLSTVGSDKLRPLLSARLPGGQAVLAADEGDLP